METGKLSDNYNVSESKDLVDLNNHLKIISVSESMLSFELVNRIVKT